MDATVHQFPPYRKADPHSWARRPRPRAPRHRLLAQIYFFHRPQNHRHPIWFHGAVFFAVRIFPDADDALANRASGHAGSHYRAAAGKSSRPTGGKRHHFARSLQFVRRDARDDHGVSRNRAAGICGVRQLRRAADDRRGGHGVSARQHGELSGVFSWRPGDVRELFHSGRRGASGLDFVFAAGDVASRRTDNYSGSSE